MAKLPIRLIICVDGTSQTSSANSGATNVHRISSSIRRGACTDNSSGLTFDQIITYIPGIGSTDDAFSKDRIQARVLGQGYLKQIQDVYESCSQLSEEKDEVWLFGFGRGAFVVRAVAGLLHSFGAVISAGRPEFAKDFKRVLKDMESLQSNPNLSLGLTPSVMSERTRAGPRVQFIGVFETIKAIHDNTFDISFTSSIQHMRHALALHEDRKQLTPETLFPEEFYGTVLKESGRSFVQAYFIGQHNDIGGSAKSCGLALYPCQWMLLEARQCGLVLDVIDETYRTHHLPSTVFPRLKKQGSKEEDGKLWCFTADNGIVVTMQDLREIQGSSPGHQRNNSVKLVSPRLGSIRQKKARSPFTSDGYLNGYCDWAPQGTIIHPSVYLLLDNHVTISLETKELRLQRNIEEWRSKMLGTQHSSDLNVCFWLGGDDADISNLGAIRVLVCGNTGVGKSTLINKTFGVDVVCTTYARCVVQEPTDAHSRLKVHTAVEVRVLTGIHDVREEITWEGRPDLILHDSGGFEAGTDDEFQAIEAFLKEKSAIEDVRARVHIIWFCIDINSPRTTQTATEKLFLAVSKYAQDVPMVVVATKKDEFLDIEFGARRKMLKKEGKPYDEDDCERYAEGKLQDRIDTIRSEMESLAEGRLDACLAVSHDDHASISHLSETTSHCFDTDHVRLLYVRAQVLRTDLKVNMAQAEIMKQYKRLLRRTGANWAPLGATVTRKLSTNQVVKSIINCFGLPAVSADLAVEALKKDLWNTLGSNVQLALSEVFHLIGLTCTGFAAGSPIWLFTGTVNSSYIVPTTCRLFLIMACDLTLVLARSFKEVAFHDGGMPDEKDVSAAARNYAVRGYSQHVHRDIKKLIPRKDLVASFKIENVQRGVDDIFIEYKDKLLDDVDLPLEPLDFRSRDRSDDDTSTEADSMLFADAKEANLALAELEANASTPIAELDGKVPIIELPAHSKADNVSHKVAAPRIAELEG